MIATKSTGELLTRLPCVRGKLRANVPLARYTWFRVGGPAEVLFAPADCDDLVNFLRHCPQDVHSTVIGLCSNMLVRDGGIRGVVIRLVHGLSSIEVQDEEVRVGAGALNLKVLRTVAAAGLGGLEFLGGIPGSMGGTVRMNAGAYGQDVAEKLVSAVVVNRSGFLREKTLGELGFGYRVSGLADDDIVVEVRLRGYRDTSANISERMRQFEKTRTASQPVRERTGGSTFINPSQDPAWSLIDAAGCRGLRRGGAVVSEKHCNFLINTGDATAADLEGLGEEVRRRVFDATGVELAWEIRRVGFHDSALSGAGL